MLQARCRHVCSRVGFTFGTAEYRDDERGVPPFVAQVQVGRFAQFDGRRMRQRYDAAVGIDCRSGKQHPYSVPIETVRTVVSVRILRKWRRKPRKNVRPGSRRTVFAAGRRSSERLPRIHSANALQYPLRFPFRCRSADRLPGIFRQRKKLFPADFVPCGRARIAPIVDRYGGHVSITPFLVCIIC